MGGSENAVAAARALLRRGVAVHSLAHDRAPVHVSRGVSPHPIGDRLDETSFANGLGRVPDGSVLIPLSDDALLLFADRYEDLTRRFRPAHLVPETVRAMLDKQRTVEIAARAGLGTPRQWIVDRESDIDLSGVEFPVIVKPRRTFELAVRRGVKFLRVGDEHELSNALRELSDLPGGVVVVEFVPGGDHLLSSYNTLRSDGRTVLEFTKRIERRYPTSEGGGTLHEMVDLPATAAAGRRFFDAIDVDGFANVEFKLDTRDGELKLIECNHRLTAATELMERCGLPASEAVYRQAAGLDLDDLTGLVPEQRWYWYPVRDLREARRLGFPAVLSALSMIVRRPVFPYWRASDPMPSLREAANRLEATLARWRQRRADRRGG